MSEEYQLEILPEAKDELASIDQTQAKQIEKKIRWLAKNAKDLPHMAMKGEDWAGLFRLRVGDYRVIYSLEHENHTLTVTGVGHRKDVYDK